MSSVLEFRDATKVFAGRGGRRRGPGTRAVAEISVTLDAGEILALVGESGAGKTTAGRLALGLERADAGRVLFDGLDLATLSGRQLRRLRRRTHLIFQDPYQALHPGLRVVDIVAEPLSVAGEPRRQWRERAAQALEEVRLTPAEELLDRYPHELSGGQRQRVAFARAVVAQPRLVVADEPVSMLDVSLQAGVLALVDELRGRYGMAFLFITHDLAVARHVADRVAVMHHGRLLEIGPADAVVSEPRHPYTEALLRAVEDVAAPAPSPGPFPPGGQPCRRHGRCQASDASCLADRLTLVAVTPEHGCAVHLDTASGLTPDEKGQTR